MQLNIQKRDIPIKKQAEDLNRHFPNKDIQTAIGHMERCSLLLNHQKNANHNFGVISPHTFQNDCY